ncbi:hypothetical protein HDU82_000385 [Entophlyctis luteolus]|nr:hypothetical protein HDU82_000385 [Entophlyctis luteolus]
MGKTQLSNNSTLSAVHRTISRPQAGPALKPQTMQQNMQSQQTQRHTHTPAAPRPADPLAPLRRGLAVSGLPAGPTLFGTMFDMPAQWLASCTPARPVARLPASMKAKGANASAPAVQGSRGHANPPQAQPADTDDWKKAVWVDFYTADKHHTLAEDPQMSAPQQHRQRLNRAKSANSSSAKPQQNLAQAAPKRPMTTGSRRNKHSSLKSTIAPPLPAKTAEIFAFIHDGVPIRPPSPVPESRQNANGNWSPKKSRNN